MSYLDNALIFAAQGFKLFPLWAQTKKPHTLNGWHDASGDETQVRAWWTKWPDANIGIACGPSGLCVLDCDHGLETVEEFYAWRAATGLPETYTVRTGRRDSFGVQLYFAGAIPDVGMWKLRGCEGQVKSLGGYVCAAGDIHPDTKEKYQVLCDVPIMPTPEFVRKLQSEKPKTGKAGEPIKENRNIALMSIAGKWRNDGMSRECLEVALLQHNADNVVPPMDEEEVKRIAYNASRYDVPPSEGKVVFGAPNVAPPEQELPQRSRPIYPIEVWDGTALGEFAEVCGHDSNIPGKLFAEAFRCALGAVVGDRLSCPGVDGALPRSYTVIVAPKGKGKGTAIRRAVRFFSQTWDGTRGASAHAHGTLTSITPGLLSGDREFIWKPRGIGAWIAAASSVPGMARLTKDLDSTIKNKPHMVWGNTLPRIFAVHEEMKTFLSTLFIEGGVGSGMEGVVCQLWDDISFHGTATGTRDAVYGEMMFSMLAGVTEQDWFDLLSRGNAVGGGLMSRFNMIGTEGNYENVSRMNPPDFTALQETFLPRVLRLEDAHIKLLPTEAADRIISKWTDNLPEGSERMNIHAWRSALLLAWLRHEETITAKTAEDAVLLGQYQVESHDYYRTKSADTANARVQGKILRSLELKGPTTKRELQRRTHADRDGTDLWSRALDGLIKDRAVGTREDGTYYLADETT